MGPIKRMIGTLDAIATGNFSQRLVLRQGDVLEDVAQSINRMADQLQKRYSRPS